MAQAKTICEDCEKVFLGGPMAHFCPACRKRRNSEAAKHRRLWEYGARGRWGNKEKPQWVGPSAELLPDDTAGRSRRQ